MSAIDTRMQVDAQIVRDLAHRYLRFAEEEVRDRSPSYEVFARGIAEDPEVLGFLATLPAARQQPNLLLASVRKLFGVQPNWGEFRRQLLANTDGVRAFMLAHSTQTNEPARCAVLLPVLAHLPQPLALIEVGASAGLCLLPDFYGFNYGSTLIRPSVSRLDYPVFTCKADPATPVPARMPRIVWRAGIDLNPIDVTDPDQTGWLETLVWPEQPVRLQHLRAALRIAADHRPRIVKADLAGDALAELCREAPKDATLVIFHTATLVYVPDVAERAAFAERAMSLCSSWISNEQRGVFPALDKRAGSPTESGRFLMSVNEVPTAWTDAHGAALDWIVRDA